MSTENNSLTANFTLHVSITLTSDEIQEIRELIQYEGGTRWGVKRMLEDMLRERFETDEKDAQMTAFAGVIYKEFCTK